MLTCLYFMEHVQLSTLYEPDVTFCFSNIFYDFYSIYIYICINVCAAIYRAGTSKYPKENAYKSYLSKHGGRSNASTSMDDTTFKFEVGADYLRRATSSSNILSRIAPYTIVGRLVIIYDTVAVGRSIDGSSFGTILIFFSCVELAIFFFLNQKWILNS